MAGARLAALLLLLAPGLAAGIRQDAYVVPNNDPAEGASPRPDARDKGSSASLASAAAESSAETSAALRARVVELEAELAAAKSRLAIAESSHTRGTLDLEYEYRTFQSRKSGACWLLSFVEDLRFNGVMQRIFKNSITFGTTTESRNGEDVIHWTTAAGHAGSFEIYDFENRGTWQQVLESIFMLHRQDDPKKAKKFQDLTKTVIGIGPEGRAEEIQGYFNLIDLNIRVNVERQSIRNGLDAKRLENFFAQDRDSQDPNVVFVLEKKTSTGGHAIAVEKVTAKGSSFELATYNQQASYDPEDLYKVHAGNAVCQSKEYKKNHCDGLLRIQIKL